MRAAAYGLRGGGGDREEASRPSHAAFWRKERGARRRHALSPSPVMRRMPALQVLRGKRVGFGQALAAARAWHRRQLASDSLTILAREGEVRGVSTATDQVAQGPCNLHLPCCMHDASATIPRAPLRHVGAPALRPNVACWPLSWLCPVPLLQCRCSLHQASWAHAARPPACFAGVRRSVLTGDARALARHCRDERWSRCTRST